MDKFRKFIEEELQNDDMTPEAFEKFEQDLRTRTMALERKAVADKLGKYDIDASAIVIDGTVFRRMMRQSQTYMTAAGEVVVERTLYKDRTDEQSRCVSPMELRAGVINGIWSRSAAKMAVWVVAQMTPRKGEELFRRVGTMTPSKSSIGRLAAHLSESWEQERETLERALREAIEIPQGTMSIAVSLDGVFVPMDKTGWAQDTHGTAASETGSGRGPSGYREVGCGTVAFCNAHGELLSAIRMARAPEPNKALLKQMLSETVRAVIRRRPELQVVKLADGAADNWTFLDSECLPAGVQVLDNFHANEHLSEALSSVYGVGTTKTKLQFEQWRGTLRCDKRGASKVIQELKRLSKEHPNNLTVARELGYFQKHKKRMNYASVAEQGLMIGSGVVEAACKTLVTQRLKQSGMRWSKDGAQSILTPRGWDQSEKFDAAWALLAATFESKVTVYRKLTLVKTS